MTFTEPLLSVSVCAPDTSAGRSILRAYFVDIVGRYHGRPATEEEVDLALRDEPSDDLVPPHGLFLLAQADGAPVGCVGLRLLPANVAELTRVFVMAAARGRGTASRLIGEAESRARELGVRTLRLDVRRDLTEAHSLYARLGYREVDPFNNSRYAGHWFAKELGAE